MRFTSSTLSSAFYTQRPIGPQHQRGRALGARRRDAIGPQRDNGAVSLYAGVCPPLRLRKTPFWSDGGREAKDPEEAVFLKGTPGSALLKISYIFARAKEPRVVAVTGQPRRVRFEPLYVVEMPSPFPLYTDAAFGLTLRLALPLA